MVVVTRISIDPPQPRAGQMFRVTVKLSGPVPAPLRLGWEKQRLYVVPTAGYAPELRPTGADYFASQVQPITVDTDADTGETTFIVREDAKDALGEPVVFPDNLVLTYFVDNKVSNASDADAYRIRIVKIRPAVAAPRRRGR